MTGFTRCAARDFTDEGKVKVKAGQRLTCATIHEFDYFGYARCKLFGTKTEVKLPPGILVACPAVENTYRPILPQYMWPPGLTNAPSTAAAAGGGGGGGGAAAAAGAGVATGQAAADAAAAGAGAGGGAAASGTFKLTAVDEPQSSSSSCYSIKLMLRAEWLWRERPDCVGGGWIALYCFAFAALDGSS
jgi:hypothetical protein